MAIRSVQDPDVYQNIIPGRPPVVRPPKPGTTTTTTNNTTGGTTPPTPTNTEVPGGSPGVPYPIGSYKTWTGKVSGGAVPPGEYNALVSLLIEWQGISGFVYYPTDQQMLAMANLGVETLADFGKFMSEQASATQALSAVPWAKYGLSKDEYVSASMIFGTTYKQITGQDISPEALAQAFQNPRDPTGGLLTGSEYRQQLMNDANLQKTFGWIKYGLDFSAWTQQKLQSRTAFGRDINDSEAATILQYNRTASGPNMAVSERSGGQQRGDVGVGGSVAR